MENTINNEIILDTRNQKDDFVQTALEKLGYNCQTLQLYFGDVALKSNILNAVDLKSSGGGLIELSKNICSKDHSRLRREIDKAIQYGGKLTFLCFEPNITCIDDIANWQVPTFKSKGYKWVYISKRTGKQVSKVTLKQTFDRLVKSGKIILNATYDYGLECFINEYTYRQKEFAHNKGVPMTKVKPETLMKAIKTMSTPDHYGKGVTINFEFTTKEKCGEKIIEILTKEN